MGVQLQEKNNLKQEDKRSDKIPVCILLGMYSIQGIIFGFFNSSLSLIFSERKEIPISELGWLSLSTYPFSFKILFAPFLDAYYNQTFGKRKTYIIPIQYMVSILFVLASYFVQSLIDGNKVKEIGVLGFVITFLVSLQDIAVDAWALKLLKKENLNYASPLQSIGIAFGWMLSTSVYLELIKWFPSHFDTNVFFRIVGVVFVLLTVYIHFFIEENFHHKSIEEQQREKKQKNKKQQSLRQIYSLLTQFYKNKNLRFLIVFLIFRGLGFAPLTASFSIKLVKRGIAKEYISNLHLFLTPFKLFIPIFAAKYLKKYLGLRLNILFLYLHIVVQIFQYLVWEHSDYFKEESFEGSIIMMVVFEILNILTSLTMMSRMSFYGKIAQEGIEGSYITCLTSVANLGFKLWLTGYLFLNDSLSESQDKGVIFLGWIIAVAIGIYSKGTFENFEKLDKSEWVLDVEKHKENEKQIENEKKNK